MSKSFIGKETIFKLMRTKTLTFEGSWFVSPMPPGTPGRKLCRAAAAGGTPGGCIPRGGAAWCLRGLGSGRCSPEGRRLGPWARSETGFLGGIPQSPAGEGEGGTPAGSRAPCWGAGGCWDPAGPAGTEGAASPDGRRR